MKKGKDRIVVGKKVKETEKAILFNTSYEHSNMCFAIEIWFPKSQVIEHQDGLIIPFWLYKSKVKEINQKVSAKVDLCAVIFDGE